MAVTCRKAMWVSHGKADDTTPQHVEWTRGLLIVYDMHDVHAPIQQDLIWNHVVNNSPNTCHQYIGLEVVAFADTQLSISQLNHYLQPRLQLLLRIAQSILAPSRAAPHLIDICQRRSLGLDRRVIIESRRSHDLLVRHLAVALPVRSLINIDHDRATQAQIVLQSHIAVRDKPIVRPSAQLPAEFGALS